MTRPRACRGSAGRPRSRSASACRGRAATMSGRNRSASAQRRFAVVGDVDRVALSSSSSARLSALSRRSSATSTRQRAPAQRAAPRLACRRRRRRAPRGQRQPDDELAALAEAVAVRLDAAAVHLDQAAGERQADAQAALRARRCSDRPGVNISKMRGICSAAMPMPLSLTRTTPRRRRAATSGAMPAAGGVYLAALFSRLENTCASRARSPSTSSGSSGRLDVSACAAASISGRPSRAPARRRAGRAAARGAARTCRG